MQRRRRGLKGMMRWEPCEMIDIRKGDVFRAYSGAPVCCAREDARHQERDGRTVPAVRTLERSLQPGDYA